jgi:Mg/Co/Ni transporter MgtE
MTIAFIHAHPHEAARALEQLSTNEIADLVSSLPESEAAQLLGSMLPQYAARLADTLETELLSNLLAQLSPAQAVIILTTVTDIADFMSFLGIATLLSGML